VPAGSCNIAAASRYNQPSFLTKQLVSMNDSTKALVDYFRRNAGRWGVAGAAVVGATGLGLLAAKLTERHFAHLFDDNLDDLLQGEDDWMRDLVERT
jgi:hypothetical protein